MNIYSEIKQAISQALGLNAEFSVETPKFAGQGDVSINIAMVLAKQFAKNPVVLAGEFLPKILELPFVAGAEVAGAGFINIYLKPEFLHQAFAQALNPEFGMSSLGRGEKINVEYCSANPTGPVHIGHTRGTIYGDVLSELLAKNGFNVTREYYVNDAGGQVQTLLKSVFIRVKQLMGEKLEIPEGCYPGEYLIPVAEKVLDVFGAGAFEKPKEVLTFVMNKMLEMIKHDLLKLKVKHDVFTSEAAIIESGEVERAIEVLQAKGLLYKGILPQPKGKLTEEWEPREQLLFKATEFGDSEDRALKKSDGTNTYFTSDVAYHKNKLDRGFFKLVLVVGADHLGYITRITAATKALTPKPKETSMEVKACQIVKFLENGEPVRMSKRKGTFTTLAEVLEEVDVDILRFILLTKKNDSQMDFDLTKVKEQSKENPIFYIQYAFSRGSSVCKTYGVSAEGANLKLLTETHEVEFMKKILEYPKAIEMAVKKLEPHLIANYVHELASQFHSLWNMGNENHKLRFIIEDEALTKARMFMVYAMLNVISSAFSIFKITPLEKM